MQKPCEGLFDWGDGEVSKHAYRDRMLEAARTLKADERALKRRIAKLYEDAAEDMASKAASSRSGSLTERFAWELSQSLRERTKELWTQVGDLTRSGMERAADRAMGVQTSFLEDAARRAQLDMRFNIRDVFASTRDDAVAAVLRGGIYGGNSPGLSKRIWNNEALQNGKMEQIIAQAVAKGESPVKLAKALNAYVNPQEAQPSNWNDIYDIPFTHKVDYNAKRLAITSIRHASWAATMAAARENPYADFVRWELTPAHVIFDICDAHAAHDEGLGEGNFSLDNVPLPHPFCTCLYYVDTHKSLDEVARELRSWADGERSDPKLDRMFGDWEGNKKPPMIVLHSSYKDLNPVNYDTSAWVDVDEGVRAIVRSASEDITRDFPMLDDYLHAIGFEHAEGAATAHLTITPDGRVGQVIALEQRLWHNEQAIRSYMATGDHIDSGDPRAIIAHEYGHVMLNTVVLQDLLYVPGGRMLPALQNMLPDTVEQVMKEAEAYLMAGIPESDWHERILEELGSRALDGPEELFSQAIAQHYYGNRKTVLSNRAFDWAKNRLR